MKTCILQGSPRKHGNTAQLLAPFTEEMEKNGCLQELTYFQSRTCLSWISRGTHPMQFNPLYQVRAPGFFRPSVGTFRRLWLFMEQKPETMPYFIW